MHKRLSLHQVAFMGESSESFFAFCHEIGVANAVVAAPKLKADGINTAPTTGPKIASVNDVFSAATFPETFALAQTLGAQSLYLLTGGRGDCEWGEAAERFARQLGELRAPDIPVLIENAPALYADIHFAYTLADTIRLAEIADTGICVELFACWAEADLKALFRRAMPRTGLVQVSDYCLGDRAYPCRAVPGDGVIPLERLVGDLLEAGYQGLFDIELVGPRIDAEGPRAAAKRALDFMSELLVKLGA